MAVRINNSRTTDGFSEALPPDNPYNRARTVLIHGNCHASGTGANQYWWHRAGVTSTLPSLNWWFGANTSGAGTMAVAISATVRTFTKSGWNLTGEHTFAFDYDGTPAAAVLNCYLDGVAADTLGGSVPVITSAPGPLDIGNRFVNGGAADRPAQMTYAELVEFDAVLTPAEHATYASTKNPMAVRTGLSPVVWIRWVGGRCYDVIRRVYLDHQMRAIDFNLGTLTGTATPGQVWVQEHCGTVARYMGDTGTRVPLWMQTGPNFDSATLTMKKLRTAAITGRPKLHQRLNQASTGAWGFCAGVVPIAYSNDFFVLLYGGSMGSMSATGPIAGEDDLADADGSCSFTPSAISDCLSELKGQLRSVTCSGGSGTFAFGELVTQATSGATGRFAAESGGVVYLYDGSSSPAWDASNSISSASASRATVTATALYTPRMSKFIDPTNHYYSGGAGTLTDRTAAAATEIAGPVAACHPDAFPAGAQTNLKFRGMATSGVARVGNFRSMEVINRAGTVCHLYSSGIEYGPAINDDESPVHFFHDNGVRGVNGTRFVFADPSTRTDRSLAIGGIAWRQATGVAGHIMKGGDIAVGTDANGVVTITNNSGSLQPATTSGARHIYAAPFAWLFRGNGDGTWDFFVGTEKIAGVGTIAAGIAAALSYVGSASVASLTDDDNMGWIEACVWHGAGSQPISDADWAGLVAFWTSIYPAISSSFSKTLGAEGSSTMRGVCGRLVSAAVVADDRGRSVLWKIWQSGALASTRVANFATSGATYTTMEARDTKIDAFFDAYQGRGPMVMLEAGGFNDIFSGIAVTTVRDNAATFNGDRRTGAPGLKVVRPDVFRREVDGTYNGARTTFNGYSAAEVGAHFKPDTTVDARAGQADASGDGFHLVVGAYGVAGTGKYASEIVPSLRLALAETDQGRSGPRRMAMMG